MDNEDVAVLTREQIIAMLALMGCEPYWNMSNRNVGVVHTGKFYLVPTISEAVAEYELRLDMRKRTTWQDLTTEDARALLEYLSSD